MTFTLRNKRNQLAYEGESMTEQAHRDEVKIQNIIAKHQKTGLLNHVSKYEGTYSDMASATDFTEAQNIIAEAKSMFETVPSEIRAIFDNQPEKFLDFMQNQENIESIEEMGLDASHLRYGEHR